MIVTSYACIHGVFHRRDSKNVLKMTFLLDKYVLITLSLSYLISSIITTMYQDVGIDSID